MKIEEYAALCEKVNIALSDKVTAGKLDANCKAAAFSEAVRSTLSRNALEL